MSFLLKSMFEDGITINYTLRALGNNYLLLAQAGEEHIGSIVLAIPRLSLEDSKRISSTVSVLNVIGHKDEEIARPLAKALCKTTNQPAVAIAGIHYDGLRPYDIRRIQMINEQAVKKVGDWVNELKKTVTKD